ncbi:MAG: hypothetical protein JWQ11_2637, partial [Rhizobacter sp.]|nr:hypothetical protein [Rhizobacter sp.]
AVPSADTSEAAVHALVDALNASTPGDGTASLRVFRGRPHVNLVESYGREFAQSLEAAPIGQWRVQTGRGGAKAIRLDATMPAKPADFELLRGVVLQDWTDATMAEQRSAAVKVLAKKYKLKTEGDAS